MTFLVVVGYVLERRQMVITRIEGWWVMANFIVYVSGMEREVARKQTESVMRTIQNQSKKVCSDKRVSCNMQERQNGRTDTLRSGARFPISRFTALATSACEF
jgi:hypothetical protein